MSIQIEKDSLWKDKASGTIWTYEGNETLTNGHCYIEKSNSDIRNEFEPYTEQKLKEVERELWKSSDTMIYYGTNYEDKEDKSEIMITDYSGETVKIFTRDAELIIKIIDKLAKGSK